METWVINVIAPIALAVVTWLLGRNGRRIDQTSKIVGMLQDEISRLSRKVENMEAKLEAKDRELESKSVVIQEAFRCRTPSAKCPVLNKLFEYNSQKETDEQQRVEELQSGEYTPQYDPVHGGSTE